MRQYAGLFLLLSLIYHSNFRPIASGDSMAAAVLPFSIVLDGTITLDRFGRYAFDHIPYHVQVAIQRGDHWYSAYPIGGPVLISPLYLPLRFIPGIRNRPPEVLLSAARVIEKFVAVTLAALTAVVMAMLLRRLIPSQITAWMLTLVFALATGNWSTSSQALWQHTFGGLAIVGCLYSVSRWNEGNRWHWAAGVCAAWALAIRPTNVVLLLALALAIRSIGTLARVMAIPAVAGLTVLAYNLSAYGRISGSYPVEVTPHWLSGLAGILFSPGRGLLIYTPLAIFALAALFNRAQHRTLLTVAGAFTLLHICLVALWPVWWGGYCWGPRLLTEIAGPVVALIAIGWSAVPRTAFVIVCVYGVLIQALGVYFYPKGHWDHTPVSITEDAGRLWNWNDNPIARTYHGGFVWEPYAIVSAGLQGGFDAAARKMKELGISQF